MITRPGRLFAAVLLLAAAGTLRSADAAKSPHGPDKGEQHAKGGEQGGGEQHEQLDYEPGWDSVPDVEPDSPEAVKAGAAFRLRKAADELEAQGHDKGLSAALHEAANTLDGPLPVPDEEGLSESEKKAAKWGGRSRVREYTISQSGIAAQLEQAKPQLKDPKSVEKALAELKK